MPPIMLLVSCVAVVTGAAPPPSEAGPRGPRPVRPDPGGGGAPEPAREPPPRAPEAAHDHERHGHDREAGHADRRRVVVENHDAGPPRTRKAASETDVTMEEIARVPRTTPENLLELSPGVVVGSFAEAAHPGTVFIRGFDSDDGKDLATTVEGIPVNEVGNTDAHGFADTRFLIPELVTRVRIAQGSFDPAQGDFAVAGSADWSLGLASRGLVHAASADTFGQVRTTLLYGPPGQPAGTFLAADLQGGPSYGEQRDVAAGRAMVGFEHDLGGHTHVRLLGTYYENDFRHPGVVRLDDAEAGRVPCSKDVADVFCAYDPRLGGHFRRLGAGARIFRHAGSVPFSLGGYVTGKHHVLRENFTGFTTDLDHPGGPRGDGIRQSYGFVTVGLYGRLGLRTTVAGRSQGFDVGFDLRADHGRARLDRLRFDDGTPYGVLFDNRFVTRRVATFAGAHVEPVRFVALDGGLRMEAFFADVLDRRAGSRTRPLPAVRFLPRVSATIAPGRIVEATVAYGQGVRSPDPNGLVRAAAVVPTRTHATEAGVRLFGSDRRGVADFDARVFGFYTFVPHDLVFDEEDGRNADVGASHRFGVGGAFSVTVADVATVRAGGAYARAHLRDDAAPWRWLRGPAVPYVPRFSGRLDAVAGHDFEVRGEPFVWHATVGATLVGHRPLPSGRFGPGYAVADASVWLRWRWIEGGVALRNLTNARYYPVQLEYASSFDPRTAAAPVLPALHVAPGAPFSAMFTLRIFYEPGEWAHFVHDRQKRRRS